ncbi:MAG: twin-arginine translocase TatA/TatE family subunit [Bacteroidia bacterium]|nr:twin-arginine translocase TatA/TatE family subunit [Bacteroidia bacterium]
MFGLGTSEILLILFFVLLFFGAKKIPELARGLGRGIREFKDATNNIQREIEKEADSPAKSEKS